jgi:hypothetical protein
VLLERFVPSFSHTKLDLGWLNGWTLERSSVLLPAFHLGNLLYQA